MCAPVRVYLYIFFCVCVNLSVMFKTSLCERVCFVDMFKHVLNSCNRLVILVSGSQRC